MLLRCWCTRPEQGRYDSADEATMQGLVRPDVNNRPWNGSRRCYCREQEGKKRFQGEVKRKCDLRGRRKVFLSSLVRDRRGRTVSLASDTRKNGLLPYPTQPGGSCVDWQLAGSWQHHYNLGTSGNWIFCLPAATLLPFAESRHQLEMFPPYSYPPMTGIKNELLPGAD